MRVLVTGADGFAGRHLCAHLREAGDEVVELHGPRAAELGSSARHVDLTHEAAVRDAVDETQPEGVIHLGAFGSIVKSHAHPARALAVNALGTTNLLAAVRDRCPRARVLVVSSCEVYGPLPEGVSATEASPLQPVSPFAASKVSAELMAGLFHRSYGLHVLVARPFNHLGAGQEPTFAVPSFAAQLRAIARGDREPVLRVGNLDPVRDYTHVWDMVAGYRLLLREGRAGETYNLCSGEGHTLRSVLDEMLALSGLSVRLELDPARLRPAEIPRLVGVAERARALGWRPQRTLTEALSDALGRPVAVATP
ncbi:NAD-dependent epimerase/dehydratase family protein [Aggregicoccus sp. 17bor-14]|uniref:GDP-mannose 4,6-dehydratase n=1 Tax=Myxococcaceae TaxID=31 RepID=UPI00129C684A|nr:MULTISPECIES: GDP-mannose 4,6-dehydratase [Myxococcaceae]MBF5042712.1 GDP-mannose 4,6-dehydratase [Simulacricoccus sp. 17bor-14]MRI88480.1 NAD-dependent epimerase/dehydratase family protein [Aggregicoccus sp. 17bor-14]